MRISAKVYEGQIGDTNDFEIVKNDRTFGWDFEAPYRSEFELHKAVLSTLRAKAIVVDHARQEH